jgi:methionyl-tRNA synthetase
MDITLTDGDYEIVLLVNKELQAYIECLESIKLRDGLKHILAISRIGNGYIQAMEPWKLVKGSPNECARAGSVMSFCANIVCLMSVMLQPYMPQTSTNILTQLNV